MSNSGQHDHSSTKLGTLILGALGVVFGDIGTSPLYALKVSVEEAEYWEGPGKLAELFGIAKAAMTGQQFDGGDHAKISIDKNASVR
jgi:hypothetical protein